MPGQYLVGYNTNQVCSHVKTTTNNYLHDICLYFAFAANLRQVKRAQCSVLQAHTLSISEYIVPNDDIGDESDVDLDAVEPFQGPLITRPEKRVRILSNELTAVRDILRCIVP